MSLSTAWTQGLTGEAKSNFESLVRNSTLLLSKLKEIIEDKERSLQALSLSADDFKDPNWSHKQAFRNGELSSLKKMKDIITI